MNTRKITTYGGNLWRIAAAQMGDATQASRIAVLAGLSDPVLPDVQLTLTIPAPDKTQSGGLPPQ